MNTFLRSAFLALSLVFIVSAIAPVEAEVLVLRTPDGGLQPRLVNGQDGSVHLLYFKKRITAPSAREGNLYYREFLADERRFGLPVKVSSTAYDLQTFAISRAAMAVDGAGRVHVLWYRPRINQFFYSRSDAQRSSFEVQRAMVSDFAEGIDAAGDVAARGNEVALLWGAGALSAEESRTVYARFSQDGGEVFGPELQVGDQDLGACACCSLAGEFDAAGALHVAYRSAIDGTGRHMQLLTLHSSAPSLAEAGETLRGDYAPLQPLQEWDMSSCPLSTNDFALDSQGETWAAFETAARVVRLKEGEAAQTVAGPATPTRQKNPAIAVAQDGSVLTAWGEAISHSKGGLLNAQLEDAEGRKSAWRLAEEWTLPKFSFPAAAALGESDFLLVW